jgi:hypothetical protein
VEISKMSWEILSQERTNWIFLPTKYGTKRKKRKKKKKKKKHVSQREEGQYYSKEPQIKNNCARLAKTISELPLHFKSLTTQGSLANVYLAHRWFGATLKAQAKTGMNVLVPFINALWEPPVAGSEPPSKATGVYRFQFCHPRAKILSVPKDPGEVGKSVTTVMSTSSKSPLMLRES